MVPIRRKQHLQQWSLTAVTGNRYAVENNEGHAFHVLAGSVLIAGRSSADRSNGVFLAVCDAAVKIAAVFFGQLHLVANDKGATALQVDTVAGRNKRRPVAYAYACAWRSEEDRSLFDPSGHYPNIGCS